MRKESERTNALINMISAEDNNNVDAWMSRLDRKVNIIRQTH